MSKPLKLIPPTPEEDAVITAAASGDPDALPLTDAELSRFRRMPGRPIVEKPKVFTGIRLDADVIDAFRSTGKGWQTRINSVLREWLNTHRDEAGHATGGRKTA